MEKVNHFFRDTGKRKLSSQHASTPAGTSSPPLTSQSQPTPAESGGHGAGAPLCADASTSSASPGAPDLLASGPHSEYVATHARLKISAPTYIHEP